MAKRKQLTQADVDEAKALLALMQADYQEQVSKPIVETPKAESVKIPARKNNAAMVTITVDGEKRQITPSANFDRKAGMYLDNIEYQLELLSRCTGKNFETTEQKIDYIENAVIELRTKCVNQLRKPVKRKNVKHSHSDKLAKV